MANFDCQPRFCVWEQEKVQHDVISEMCASMVIFRWRLNCKRQTWISLCLSLSSWQEQSQKFGWSSSWPRCSVQISATRWQCRPLHRLEGYCKPRRVFYSEERTCGTTCWETFPFYGPLMTARSRLGTGRQIQSHDRSYCGCSELSYQNVWILISFMRTNKDMNTLWILIWQMMAA